MTGNITSSSKGKTDRNTPMDYVEDDVDELSDSDISKAYARVFDETYNQKTGVLKLSKFFDTIGILGEGFHSDDLAGHLQKVDPNESVSYDRFDFVSWYVDKEVSLDHAEEAERLEGWV